MYLYFKRKVVMRSVQEEEVPLPGPHSAHKVPPPFAESPKHNHEPETENIPKNIFENIT